MVISYEIYDLLMNPEYFKIKNVDITEIEFKELSKINVLCKTSNQSFKQNKLLSRFIASDKLKKILRNIDYYSMVIDYFPESSYQQLELVGILSEYLFLNPYDSPVSYRNIISNYKIDKLDPLNKLPVFKRKEYLEKIKNSPYLLAGLSHASLPCSINKLQAIYN